MTHIETELISAWVDGCTESRQAERIEAHLAACERCAQVEARMRAVSAALSEAGAPAPGEAGARDGGRVPAPEALSRALGAYDESARRRRMWPGPSDSERRRLRLGPVAAVAAALLLLAGLAYGIDHIGVSSTRAGSAGPEQAGTHRSAAIKAAQGVASRVELRRVLGSSPCSGVGNGSTARIVVHLPGRRKNYRCFEVGAPIASLTPRDSARVRVMRGARGYRLVVRLARARSSRPLSGRLVATLGGSSVGYPSVVEGGRQVAITRLPQALARELRARLSR
jgi:hypothetical protein